MVAVKDEMGGGALCEFFAALRAKTVPAIVDTPQIPTTSSNSPPLGRVIGTREMLAYSPVA
jgi:hypothetical protein